MAKNDDDVSTPSASWHMMERYRALPRDLRGGVLHLQGCGTRHLFKAKREAQRDYNRRINTLVLEPYYWAGAEHLGGQPFTRAIKFSEDAPAPLVDLWSKDCDGTGRDFRSVAFTSCTSSVGYGLSFLFVTWDPRMKRPIVTVIPPEDVLDPWEEGAPVRLRMVECERDEDEPWRVHHVEQVWVLYDGEPTAPQGSEDRYARWDVYEHEDRYDCESAWKTTPEPVDPESNNVFAPLEKMPLFPLPTGSGGPNDKLPWVAVPALYEAAVMNRSHMNKRSDLDFGLHIANVPQRAAAGITQDEQAEITSVSYQGMWYTVSPQGKFYYVEHSGVSFEISMKDLAELERKMEIFTLSPMMSRETSNVTATGRMIDLSRAITTAQAWTLNWEDAWQQAWRAGARYARMPDAWTLEFDTSFGPRERDLERAAIVQQDYLQGDLDPLLYYVEMKNLGVYTESFDPYKAAELATKRREEDMKRLASLPVPPPRQKLPSEAPSTTPAIPPAPPPS